MTQLRPSHETAHFGVFLIFLMCLLTPACQQNETTVEEEDSPFGKNEVEPTLTASNPLLKLLPTEQTGLTFENVITDTKEDNLTNNIYKYNGSGLAVADVNNDGLQDIYFISANGKDALYINEGNLKFRDIAESAGVSSVEGVETSVTTVDINADGWIDFYVGRSGYKENDTRRNKLYINNGDLTFSEQSKEYGLDDISPTTGANFFDYDNDGDLDMYMLVHPSSTQVANQPESTVAADGKTHIPKLKPRKPLDTHRFYRNDDGKFTDVSKEAGIQTFHWGLSASVMDFNRDGWQDIFVGVDFLQPDLLFINNKNGTFTDQLDQYFKHTARHSMGTDLTDFDNDGQIDLLVTDMLPADNKHRKTSAVTPMLSLYLSTKLHGYFEQVVRNVLLRNNGNGSFSDIGCLAGIDKTHWSWSGLIFDLDNNGLRDIFISNGYRREVANKDFFNFHIGNVDAKYGSQLVSEPNQDLYKLAVHVPTLKTTNYVYQNNGDWTFEDKSGDWMTMPAAWSCGAVWADFDNDGDLDVVVNNLEDPAHLYQNLSVDQQKGNYLQIKLEGSEKNPQATGASALIHYGNGEMQYLEMNPVRGIFSSVENLFHFGLGNTQTVDKLTLRWPDGKLQELTDLPANQRLTMKHADASGYAAHIAPTPPSPQYFEEIKNTGIEWIHQENEFNDFTIWLLNPWMESELGPLCAVGDVNSDGLDDFFVGNSISSPGALFVQQPDGRFTQTSQETWMRDKGHEDHGALFFDIDRDGDQDLFVVSGGLEIDNLQDWHKTRLYLNMDGKGTFQKAGSNILPSSRGIGMRPAAYDYDGDGDQDLFIGGRVGAGNWPTTPSSMVLRFDGNHFSDVTTEVAPSFEKCGMVTDLQWADIDRDGQQELVVVGEWMPVSVFKMQNGRLENVTDRYGLAKTNGLWFRSAIADLDGDGDLDIVTGNLGLNTRFTASTEHPLVCYAKDFDNNGQLDPLVAFAEKGKTYPMVQQEVLNKWIPSLRKKFIYAETYGNATISDIYPPKELNTGLQLNAYTLETCWWENQGGQFIQRQLPPQAQTSPVQGILIDDFTNDGNVDLLLAGNKYGFEVETSQADASNGVLLKGDGRGNFVFVENTASGFWADQEVRDLATMKLAGGKKGVLVVNNSGMPQIFKRK